MAIPNHLQPILAGIPAKPGCYLMKDQDERVIYVGKAIELRSRVRSYFHASANHSPRKAEMVRHIAAIDWIVVGSELEALILEMNLIKRYQPKYNVRLKDDKRYPYIKIHWQDPYPKVTVTRYLQEDGARYFGPYTSMWAVHQTLDVLRKIFPYLTCDRTITGEDQRACLYYDIKLCLAPCIDAVDQQTYRAMISHLADFLLGKTDQIVEHLKEQMQAASEALQFERAAMIRDQLTSIERVVEEQQIIIRERIDSDVIAFARDDRTTCVQVFFIRRGKLIGREYFLLDGAEEAEEKELVEAFVKQFYTEATFIPSQVLLPTEIDEAQVIETWLRQQRGGKRVKLLTPRRGPKRSLIKLAAENASETLASLRAQWEADRSRHVEALAELQEALAMDQPPNRIECYDISNLQGTAASGSMVVFERGVPSKRLYRKFTIKTVSGQDDFASMEEVLERRFQRWIVSQEQAKKPGGKLDPAFGFLPDLLLVDGGKGQLSRAVKVLERHALEARVPVAGLAKKHEDLYIPKQAQAIHLPLRSQALFLVQRVRDEAHRFALQHHRARRRKIGTASQLDAIAGIGPARRKALLKAFGDLTGIKNAPVEQLAAVPGISSELAARIKAEL